MKTMMPEFAIISTVIASVGMSPKMPRCLKPPVAFRSPKFQQQGLKLGALGLESRVWSLGFRALGLEFGVLGFEFRV